VRRKKQDTTLAHNFPKMLIEFQNSFTERLSGKFATNAYLNIPQYLNYVATLPCDNIYVPKNDRVPAEIEAKQTNIT